jgi:hypothetical protein
MQRNNDEKMLKEAWRNFHYNYGFNIIPVGHEKIVALAIEAQTDLDLKVQLANYLQTIPAKVTDALRGFLKVPTYSKETRDLLDEFSSFHSKHGSNTIPVLSKITGIRKADDRNSHAQFFDERISDEIAEKMIATYGDIASGIAVLLREENQVMVIDFDDRQALIELLNQIGYPCGEEDLIDTLLRVFPYNPIVKTFRGFHVYCYDPDLAEIVKTYRNFGGIEIRVSHCYVLLPPSVAGFIVDGNTVRVVTYDTLAGRDLTPQNIRAPLLAPIRDYFIKQLRPQAQTHSFGLASVEQAAMTSDLKSFIVDTLVAYWKKGVRDRMTYSLAGVLRRGGVSLNDALDIIATICDKAGDEEKSNRLYQVRRQYLLPFQPSNNNTPFCAGITKFKEECLAAGIPLQVFQILISKIFGFKLTTDIDTWLGDYNQIAMKVAEMLRPSLVYNVKTHSWWLYDEEEMCWKETGREGVIYLVTRALYEVGNDAAEVIRTMHNGNIPKDYNQKINRLLSLQNIHNNQLGRLALFLSVNFRFPHIPNEIAQTLPAEVTRITGHRNGVLLWLKNGDTIFFPINPNEPEPHRVFYVTHTANSVVDETADPTPFFEYVTDIVDDKEAADYLLQFMASLLGLRRNIFKRLLIFLGGGRNGKTTFMEVVKAAFGSLVQFTTAKTILANSNDNQVLASRADLEDCAFAVIDEAPPSNLWDLETLKYLTGSEEVVVKKLYKNPKTIPVTWVHIILTNNYPAKFKQQDHATADRLVTILFPKRFSDKVTREGRYLRRRDDQKIEDLKENTAAIIQAFRLAFKEAASKDFILPEPQKISEVTDPIRQRADTVGYFLDAYTTEDAEAAEPADKLYKTYNKFVEENDLGKALGKNAFIGNLMSNNFKKRKTNGLVYIVGLRLKEDKSNQPDILSGNDNGSSAEKVESNQDYLDEFPF